MTRWPIRDALLRAALAGGLPGLLIGCAPLRVPPVGANHPASEQGAEGPVYATPDVLDVSRAVRHDPKDRPSVMTHPELPMRHMSGGDAHGHHE